MKKTLNKVLLAGCIICLLCIHIAGSGAASGGMLWERIDEGLETGFYTKLLVNPDNNSILYLATKGGGVFKSINAGQDWFPVNNGIEVQYIDWIVMDPQNSEVLYASSSLGGVYKTINGGLSWEGAGTKGWDYTYDGTEYIGIDPNNPQILYKYAHFYDSFYRSLDGGRSWRDLGNNLPGGENNNFAIDPNQSNNIYMTKNMTLFHSPDHGDTWTAISTDSPCRAWAVAIDPHNSDIYIADLTGRMGRKPAGSEQWEEISGFTGFGTVLQIAFDPIDPDIIFAVNGIEVYKSVDKGLTWNVKSEGLTGFGLFSFTVDPVNPQTLYLVNTGKVLKSVDGGDHWSVINTNLKASYINTIDVDPLNSSVIYAGTAGNGVYKSLDAGQSWNRASNGMAKDWVSAFAIVPSDTNVLYAATYVHPYGYLYRSSDGAETWSQVYEGYWWELSDLLVDPENTSILYASTYHRLYKSIDAGNSWTELPLEMESGNYARKLMFAPNDPNVLYVAGRKVYRSTDRGDGWTELGPNGETVVDLFIDLVDSNLLYALSENEFFRSSNGGTTWQQMSESYQFRRTYDLTVLPGNPHRFFVATNKGVYFSEDEGVSWRLENDTIPIGFSRVLGADPASGVVYAGTTGKGIYRWGLRANIELYLPLISRP